MLIQLILAFHVIAVVVVVAAFFVHLPWLRPVAVVLAAVAICLPYLLLRTSLGLPNPKPVAGRYEVYAMKQDVPARMLYLMVAERGGSGLPPRLISMPMTPGGHDTPRDMSGRSYGIVDITISYEDGPRITFDEEDYDLPDPDKDAYYRRLRGEAAGENGSR